ncbi:MAG: pyruvate kinase [Candidatus Hydrogenedentes bacterium]|nr:pyruvate kinase [Candidatus Hydrogenedentota bacterium]
MRRQTKIVCTIGPASCSPEMIERLIDAGMDVARLNFSHGSHESHKERIKIIREVSARKNANVAILMDLQGPKIRTGKLIPPHVVNLEPGASITVTTDKIVGDVNRISTTYANLPHDVKPGDRILLSDGTLELCVESVAPPEVHCTVVRGGELGESKGINLPGVSIAEPSLTDKDRIDVALSIAEKVDFVALSFVRSPDDIRGLRELLRESNSDIGIVAKIERPEALVHIKEIAALSDAVMVARGDLGVEVNFEDVPSIQKTLINSCNELGVPVITATQMLESMVYAGRPTRAEVTDVANAIYDGTDAVMLSAETASGKYPVEACTVMARVAAKTDAETQRTSTDRRMRELRRDELKKRREGMRGVHLNSYADAIGQAVFRMCESLDITRIVCFTKTGYTAGAIARYRPRVRITAITNRESTCRKCAIMWGVSAVLTKDFDLIEVMVHEVEEQLLRHKAAAEGDTIIIVAGTPLAEGGRTNMLKLHTVGDSGDDI